jgi:hypothetical protein
MVVTLILIGMAASPTFLKWGLISLGVIVLIFVLSSVRVSFINRIDQTPEEKKKSDKATGNGWLYLLKFLAVTLGCIVVGLLILAIPIGAFMLLFPTYGAMVAAFGVITVIIALIWLFFLAKRGGDLTNTFFFWPF